MEHILNEQEADTNKERDKVVHEPVLFHPLFQNKRELTRSEGQNEHEDRLEALLGCFGACEFACLRLKQSSLARISKHLYSWYGSKRLLFADPQ